MNPSCRPHQVIQASTRFPFWMAGTVGLMCVVVAALVSSRENPEAAKPAAPLKASLGSQKNASPLSGMGSGNRLANRDSGSGSISTQNLESAQASDRQSQLAPNSTLRKRGVFRGQFHHPWNGGEPNFRLTREAIEHFGLSEQETSALEQKIKAFHRSANDEIWASAKAGELENGVWVELAPLSPARLDELRSNVSETIGDDRAEDFLNSAREALIWDFGGLGEYRRLIELTILPENSKAGAISIRESLRQPGSSQQEASQSSKDFEYHTREFRAQTVPKRLEPFAVAE